MSQSAVAMLLKYSFVLNMSVVLVHMSPVDTLHVAQKQTGAAGGSGLCSFTLMDSLFRGPHACLNAAINHKHWQSNQLPNRER